MLVYETKGIKILINYFGNLRVLKITIFEVTQSIFFLIPAAGYSSCFLNHKEEPVTLQEENEEEDQASAFGLQVTVPLTLSHIHGHIHTNTHTGSMGRRAVIWEAGNKGPR